MDTATRRKATNDPATSATSRVEVTRSRDGRLEDGEDRLVVEEPIEFRLRGEPVATVMRTPGDDLDLAAGFFLSEGLIADGRDIGAICLGQRPLEDVEDPRGPGHGTAAVVDLNPSVEPVARTPSRRRAGPVVSSCGVCGKSSVEDVLRLVPPLDAERPATRIPLALVPAAVRRLRELQPLFDQTGAVHAAGVFDEAGEPLCVMEDIGRHNAVDKAIGRLLRQDRLPLDRHILVVSGRASFEIVQKALRARLPVVVAVSGVSDLARELADGGGVCLCGFARGEDFTVYAHGDRLVEGI